MNPPPRNRQSSTDPIDVSQAQLHLKSIPIPRFNLRSISLTRLQIMIRQHQLRVRESRLRFHRQLIYHLRHLAPADRRAPPSDFLHPGLHASQIDPIGLGQEPRRGGGTRGRGAGGSGRRWRGKKRCGFPHCPGRPAHCQTDLLSTSRECSQARSLRKGRGRKGREGRKRRETCGLRFSVVGIRGSRCCRLEISE